MKYASLAGPAVALALAFAAGFAAWGALNERVKAAENSVVVLKADLKDDLMRIERKLDWLIDRLVEAGP